MPYLFDGYNIYHAARKALEQWSAITVMGLCDFIAGDMSYIKESGKLIFDGVCPRGRDNSCQVGSLSIYYSGDYGVDADTLIEDIVFSSSDPKRLVVVSSDREIRAAVRTRKAVSLSSNEYLSEMVRRYNRPAPAPRDPQQKTAGLTPAETKYWMKVFGINDQKK